MPSGWSFFFFFCSCLFIFTCLPSRLCSKLFLRAESQVLDRILIEFSRRYWEHNPNCVLGSASMAIFRFFLPLHHKLTSYFRQRPSSRLFPSPAQYRPPCSGLGPSYDEAAVHREYALYACRSLSNFLIRADSSTIWLADPGRAGEESVSGTDDDSHNKFCGEEREIGTSYFDPKPDPARETERERYELEREPVQRRGQRGHPHRHASPYPDYTISSIDSVCRAGQFSVRDHHRKLVAKWLDRLLP